MRFRLQSKLHRHKYTHSEERLFGCNTCNKSFKTKDSLAWHSESHTTEEQRKGIICNICKRKFRKPSLFKKHMLIHTGEKPFKCTLCDKQFCQKIGLQSHMNTHNGKKRLAEEPCSVSCKIILEANIP